MVEGNGCVHHWVIAPQAGPYSEGVCNKCDAVRENFPNGFPDRGGLRGIQRETLNRMGIPDRSNRLLSDESGGEYE